MNTRNPRIGSGLDDFLEEQDLKKEMSPAALKRVIAWRIGGANDLGDIHEYQQHESEPSTPPE